MTVKQLYKLPIGTCVRCGALGSGVVVKREMVETFLRRLDGKIAMKFVEPGVYQFEDPGKPVLLVTVRKSNGREYYIAETNRGALKCVEILEGDDRERVIKGHSSRQMSFFA